MGNVFRVGLLFGAVLTPVLFLTSRTGLAPRMVDLSDMPIEVMDGSASGFSYAPTADRVAYRLDWAEGGQGLWVCDRETGNHVRVAADTEVERVDVLALSPDGTHLAYARSTHETPWERRGIGVAEVGGERRVEVAGTSVAWTRDGSRLAVADPATGRITVIDVPSLETRAVAGTPRAGNAYDQPSMAWSPDGTRLAYTIREASIAMTSLWVLTLDEVDPRLVMADGEGCMSLVPFWSPDGRLAWRLARTDGRGGARHYVQGSDGGVREMGREAALVAAGTPVWSPDGTSIIAPCTVGVGEGARTDLWAVDVESGATSRLTSCGDASGDLVWGTDNASFFLLDPARVRSARLRAE